VLCLSRKVNEKIIISDGVNRVEIMLVDICGDRVRLAFEADKSITIDRAEVAASKARGEKR
jgi:carbon storage regulator CsrA